MQNTCTESNYEGYNNIDITLRGRSFSPQDILIIKRLVKKYFNYGRTRASEEICRKLNWYQPNGWLKDRACREVLRILEQKGLIVLPPRKITPRNTTYQCRRVANIENLDKTILSKLDFSSIIIRQVKGTKDEVFWNYLVNSYHYLGFQSFVGRSLKYLFFSRTRVIGAIGWCDPVWNLNARDLPLKSLGFNINEIRHKGINNGRFLIFPWIKVPNLASYFLSLATKQIKQDWEKYYSVTPLFLETFVDPERFCGTCYRASNWLYLGMSKGYRKSGTMHSNSQAPKLYFLYPLDRQIKSRINMLYMGD